MKKQDLVRSAIIVATTAGVSVLHYETATSYIWLHQLFQRGYYVPVLLAALWFGSRGGFFAAALAGLFYVPHIVRAWGSNPTYSSSQYIEIVMFFAIGVLTGVLADQERGQRIRVEKTARKLADVNSQLEASFEQLRRADRLSALGQLSAGLAHEIRNPLGAIEGALQILQRSELPSATRQEFGQLAQGEVNRLKRLVSDFLGFARPQSPRRHPTEVKTLLDSVAALASETARGAGIHIRIDLENELPLILVDSEQIKQVLLNLAINATEAMPGGGEIVLRASKTLDSVSLEVQDQGTGIDAENLERIFDPFFTTRDGGTGLGLSIAYRIISHHGGHIKALQNTSGGMTFVVTLPLRRDAPLVSVQSTEKWA